MTKRIFITLCWISLPAFSSTFIGNGGQAGDLDLTMTLGQINETFRHMPDFADEMCSCPKSLSRNKMCKVLRSLTKEQREFCRAFIVKHAASMQSLSSRKAQISYKWMDEPLKVQMSDGKTRVVDAISNEKTRIVLINRPRFLKLPNSSRIALMTHELFHLVKTPSGYLNDEQSVGPYSTGRELLDTLGAATALLAYEIGVETDFRHLENVSRYYKPFLVTLEGGFAWSSKKDVEELLLDETAATTKFAFKYKPTDIGYRIGTDYLRNEDDKDDLKVKERTDLVYIGIGYHWLPIDSYMSRWGETNVSLFIDAIYGRSQYTIGDDILELEDSAHQYGGQAEISINVPVVHGIWAISSAQLRYREYRYRDLDIAIKNKQFNLLIGAGYGF